MTIENIELDASAAWPDPADRSNFQRALAVAAQPLDFRTDETLEKIALTDPDPVLREQAIYELLVRQGPASLPFLTRVLAEDTDSIVRQDTAWALEKCGHPDTVQHLRSLLDDGDADVADWAGIYEEELTAPEGRVSFRHNPRSGRRLDGKVFDETLYLHITCDLYVRLADDGSTWGRVRLSPLGLARVFGQAYACPVVETRNKQIVVAKVLDGLHTDRPYYESFLFKGFTERTQQTVGNFYFESSGNRVFFPSGRAEDYSEGVIKDVNVPFARYGTWFLDENIPVKDELAIRYVRGTFQGWGYLNMEKLLAYETGPMTAGAGLLSTLHHPVVGPMTNTFIVGSFKAKLQDVDGDGVLELNPFDVYATRDGETDSNLDGIADRPGMSQFTAAYDR